jgi:ribosomal protein L23
MALFSKKKEVKKEDAIIEAKPAKAPKKAVKVPKETKEVAIKTDTKTFYAGVITRPRITEKSGLKAESSIFTFEVAKTATKKSVAKAVEAYYGKKPVKVNIVNLPAKAIFARGKAGRISGVKKAIVFLKKGETIEFI